MNVGIIGATGLVGRELVRLFEDNHLNIKYKDIKFYASKKSSFIFKKVLVDIDILDENIFKSLDIAFFCASSEISEKFAFVANKCGCIVIDNSSAFRMRKEIPLIVAYHVQRCLA